MDEKDDKRGRKKGSLFDKALKAYGITSDYILGNPVEREGVVIFVTTGGRKITFREGDQPARIPWPLLTGEPPEMERAGLTAGKKQGAK